MPPAPDEAICIRQWDWSETSQTAMLFSRAHGLLRVLAKGSRRPKHPFSGGLEVLSRARIGVIVRPHSELALLTEWDLAETFPSLRSSLPIHNAGLFIADTIAHTIHDHDPHAALYDATVESLRLMRSADDVPAAMLKFLWNVLVETGYRPVLDTDVSTGEAIADAPSYRFAPALGGLIADHTEPGVPAAHTKSWRVRRETVNLLRSLDSTGLAASAAVGHDPTAIDGAARLLASYLRHVLGAEPPTMPLVFGHRLAR
jgi:DNA repair protein RecO (recombination protein O)